MFQVARTRAPQLLRHPVRAVAATTRFNSGTSNTTTNNPIVANNPKPTPDQSPTANSTSAVPTQSTGAHDHALVETPEDAEKMRTMQAPNRDLTWSRNQQPRAKAMTGPRFEQMIMTDQPRPYSAMELIHQQPVRWTKERQVACDGGGGPLGHPRIFINVDKPQICFCTYCGLPFANEHHREAIEAQSWHTYPLDPQGNSAEVGTAQRVSDEAMGHR